MNCPRCGKENPEDAQQCQSCSCALTQSTATREDINIKRSGLAIASMVLGFLSILTYGITAIPAVILGIISLVQIEKSGGRLTGRVFGIVGIAVPVVVCCLVIGLIPALNRAREQGRRAVCMGNLKQLAFVWVFYADDYDGMIVNGAASYGPPHNDSFGHANERAWVFQCDAPDRASGEPEYVQIQAMKQAIKEGELFPYCKNLELYRCPSGVRREMRTYSIVDSMNGIPQPDNPRGRGHKEVMKKLIIKDRSLLERPHERIVFIDVGWAAPGSYGVYYDKEKWWNPPPVRHIEGTTVSFTDTHAEYWKWKGEETIKLGKIVVPTQLRQHVEPKTVEGKEDLQKMQKAVWGKLGYNPSAVD